MIDVIFEGACECRFNYKCTSRESRGSLQSITCVTVTIRDLISQKACREKNVYLSFFSRQAFWRGDLVFTRPLSRETIFPEQTRFFCCRMKSNLFYLADVARGKFFLEQALNCSHDTCRVTDWTGRTTACFQKFVRGLKNIPLEGLARVRTWVPGNFPAGDHRLSKSRVMTTTLQDHV
jgi:hypothetical protein